MGVARETGRMREQLEGWRSRGYWGWGVRDGGTEGWRLARWRGGGTEEQRDGGTEGWSNRGIDK